MIVFVTTMHRLAIVLNPEDPKKSDSRTETLIVRTLFKLETMIHPSLSGKVVKKDLIRPYAHDRTVNFEKAMNSLALLETEDVGREPEIGHGGVPRAWYRAKWREIELVDEGVCRPEDGENEEAEEEVTRHRIGDPTE